MVLNVSLIVIAFISIFLLFLFLTYLILLNFLPGAFYYPSTLDATQQILELAKVTKKDTVLDLGSGDGRILIQAAKLGAKGIGYELDPLLVFRSRKSIKKLGLSDSIHINHQSFWQADFNQATIITLYQFPQYMDKLQKLLEKKLTHPVLVVSNTYQFTHKKHIAKKNQLYLYRFP